MRPILLAARAAVLALGIPVFAAAQRDVRVPVAPVTGSPVTVIRVPVVETPAGAAFERLGGARNLGTGSVFQQQSFLNRFFDNAGRNGMAAPVVPQGSRKPPKASPVKFKDMVIQRANFSEDINISEILVGLIDRADETLDLALHGLKLPNVTQALMRAKERGVKIRIIMNHSHAFPERPGEKVSEDVTFLMENGFDMRTLRGSGPYGVMHNKIIIVDRKVLKFGSFNWTTAANERNFENVVFSDAAKKIARYEARYEELWKRSTPASEGAPAFSLLEIDPMGPTPEHLQEKITYNGQTFESEMWSPNGGIRAALVRAIKASKSEIVVAMFSFNSDEIVDALIERHEKGVKVKIVVDRSQAVNAHMRPAVAKLQAAGIDLLWSSGHKPRSVMHNKFAVFDRKMLEVGSYNWTGNAEDNNFENANFTDEAELVSDFLEEFEYIYSVGTKPTPKEAETILSLMALGVFDPMNE